jgi:hypothetical protein
MKRLAAAFSLLVAALSSQAATVGWQFKGTTWDDDRGVVPFSAYLEVDTGRIARGPNPDGPNSAVGGTFRWGTNGGMPYCNSGALLSHYAVSDTGFVLSGLDTSDCGIIVWVSGAVPTGRFEVAGDSRTQWFDMTGPDLEIQVSMMGPVRSFQSVSVDYTYQMIPEPSPVALIGAGLAGLIWVRRRKDTREQA